MFKMKQKLPKWFISNKLEVRESQLHGLGVFTKEKIEVNEIFESAPVVLFAQETQEYLWDLCGFRHILMDYPFAWPEPNVDAFSLGWGGVYNHSRTPNARWDTKVEPHKALEFSAKRIIEPGEEICTRYQSEKKLWFLTGNEDTTKMIGHDELDMLRMNHGNKIL
jgi:SET domain-containing protein